MDKKPNVKRQLTPQRLPISSCGFGRPASMVAHMRALLFLVVIVFQSAVAAAQEHVSFPTSDGWLIHAHRYGEGKRGVVLVHGGRFTKESWAKQAQILTNAGFKVLAIDMRGYGESTNGPTALRSDFGSPLDVLAAVRYLHTVGATNVSVIGGSMGGDAAGEASAQAGPGEMDRVIFIGSEGGDRPEQMKGRKLFITSRNDLGSGNQLRLPTIRAHYERTPEPKELIVLEGSAHAQFIFATDQGERLMREILRFLSAP
jgi:pimeloyl-ACP methyl ester carboxylesterase